MSNWKEKDVTIIQAFQGIYYKDLYGLGNDNKIYIWSRKEGAWEKSWPQKDIPES